jgi:ABC-2 type transport system ATP-binding protein
MNLLEISNITKEFGSKKALKGVSFTLKEGEVFGLLGVNGAGKTTLSSIIVSLNPPTSGDLLFRGSSIYNDITDYRMHIGYCPQKVNLNDKLSLRENLLQAGRYYGMSESELKQRLDELVEQFDLAEYLDQTVKVLSGGYAQRFLIARALMHRPSLVVLDEPTVGLDPHIRHQLWKIIRMLKEQNVTVILTTHYLDEAEALADRVCVLDHGVVLVIDTPDNLKAHYKKNRLEEVFLQLMQDADDSRKNNKKGA